MNRIFGYLRVGMPVVLMLATVAPLRAQSGFTLPIGYSAADLGDSRSLFINPAVLSFQDPFFLAGARVLHFGVSENDLAYRQTYVSLTTPEWKFRGLGLGLRGQFLNLPILGGGGAQALASYKLADRAAIGASLGFLTQTFDRSQYDSEALQDPFLANLNSKVVADVGVGVLVRANRHLTVGAGLNHLTRPNIAYGEVKANLPIEWNLGAVIGMGFFRAGVGFTRRDDRVTPLFAVETFRPALGFVKLGFGSETASLEGQVHVMRGVNLSYRYEYPLSDLRLASSGSHELGVVFNFRRRASLHEPQWLEPEFATSPTIDPRNDFVVESVFDTLLIVDKHITRTIDDQITQQELAELPEAAVVSSDSLEPDLSFIGAGRLLSSLSALGGTIRRPGNAQDSLDVVYAMQKDHAEHYLTYLRSLGARLTSDREFSARLLIPSDMSRARLLLTYLALYCDVTDRLQIAVREDAGNTGRLGFKKIPAEVFSQTLNVAVDTFKFHINVPALRWRILSWALVIEDASGNSLFAYSGSQQIPRRFVWDWRTKGGELLSPGTFFYYLKWQSENGATYTSPKKALTVQFIDRRIAIAISKAQQGLAGPPGGTATVILN